MDLLDFLTVAGKIAFIFGLPFLYFYIGITQWRNKDKNWAFMDILLFIIGGVFLCGFIAIGISVF